MTFSVAVPGGAPEVHEWPARAGAPVVLADRVLAATGKGVPDAHSS